MLAQALHYKSLTRQFINQGEYMKKFIKAVIVASVLVSASSAFATLQAGGNKPGSNGTGGSSCPHKLNAGLFDSTAQTQTAGAGSTNTGVIGGAVVR
jgi:hypothetical protein